MGSVAELKWSGPRPEFEDWCGRMGAEDLYDRAVALGRTRGT
jgi:hypothetical protein